MLEKKGLYLKRGVTMMAYNKPNWVVRWNISYILWWHQCQRKDLIHLTRYLQHKRGWKEGERRIEGRKEEGRGGRKGRTENILFSPTNPYQCTDDQLYTERNDFNQAHLLCALMSVLKSKNVRGSVPSQRELRVFWSRDSFTLPGSHTSKALVNIYKPHFPISV